VADAQGGAVPMTGPRIGSTLRTACGVVGPAVFTAAWAIATHRQPGYSVAHEHISGLAAPDAERPHLMRAGFLVLGASSILFGNELHRRLDASDRPAGWGPSLMAASGVSILVAGLATRDRMSNAPLPDAPPGRSPMNDLHDAASVLAGVASGASLVALARRFHRDPDWHDLSRRTFGTAIAGAALTAWFLTDVTRPGNGLVQRIAVSVPLSFMARTALRMLRGGYPSASSGTSARLASTSSAIAVTSASTES
jgi:hypothetical protein